MKNKANLTKNILLVLLVLVAVSAPMAGSKYVQTGDVVWSQKIDGVTLDNIYTKTEVHTVVQSGMVVPDYTNMENTNRITANKGSWTVLQTGFVRVGYTHTSKDQNTGGMISITVNGKIVFQTCFNTVHGDGKVLPAETGGVIPVKQGDVIYIECTATYQGQTHDITGAIYSCYFIPPLYVTF